MARQLPGSPPAALIRFMPRRFEPKPRLSIPMECYPIERVDIGLRRHRFLALSSSVLPSHAGASCRRGGLPAFTDLAPGLRDRSRPDVPSRRKAEASFTQRAPPSPAPSEACRLAARFSSDSSLPSGSGLARQRSQWPTGRSAVYARARNWRHCGRRCDEVQNRVLRCLRV